MEFYENIKTHLTKQSEIIMYICHCNYVIALWISLCKTKMHIYFEIPLISKITNSKNGNNTERKYYPNFAVTNSQTV